MFIRDSFVDHRAGLAPAAVRVGEAGLARVVLPALVDRRHRHGKCGQRDGGAQHQEMEMPVMGAAMEPGDGAGDGDYDTAGRWDP